MRIEKSIIISVIAYSVVFDSLLSFDAILDNTDFLRQFIAHSPGSIVFGVLMALYARWVRQRKRLLSQAVYEYLLRQWRKLKNRTKGK